MEKFLQGALTLLLAFITPVALWVTSNRLEETEGDISDFVPTYRDSYYWIIIAKTLAVMGVFGALFTMAVMNARRREQLAAAQNGNGNGDPALRKDDLRADLASTNL